jgi:hypothetical protein
VGCKTFGVTQVMVGLYRVGLVGLRQALEAVEGEGLTDREAIVDRIIGELGRDNYLPDRQLEAFRPALWREYLRYRGEDFREFFSEVAVTVRGEPGEERDRFVELARSVFAEHELRPVFSYAAPDAEGPNPVLLIGDHQVVAGMSTKDRFSAAVRKSFSDW